MEPLHELATRIGLASTERFGFALAGGYAVQAHGFLTRRLPYDGTACDTDGYVRQRPLMIFSTT